MPGVIERSEGLTLLPLITANAHANVGMAAVGGDVHFYDIDGEKPGIVGFETDELGELLADGFGDACCAAFIHC